MMIKKGSKLYSMLYGVCPKCHNESMYLEKNPYYITETLKIHDHCSHCKTRYRLEPSFFYGSMYVSYAVGVAFAVASFVITHFFIGTSLMTSFYAIVGTLIFFMPIIMRLSRNIWINMFMSYDPALDSKTSESSTKND